MMVRANNFETPSVLPSEILGDINGDNLVTMLDAAPFAEALVSGEFVPTVDIKQDGVVDLLDVAGFVALLAVELPLPN